MTSKSYPVRARAWGEEAGPLRCFSRMLTRVRLTAVDDSDVWGRCDLLDSDSPGAAATFPPLRGACCLYVSASLQNGVLCRCIAVEFCLLVVSRVCAHELSSCVLVGYGLDKIRVLKATIPTIRNSPPSH